MHVLMTTDTLGGVFDYALALSSSLVARGATVTLASMGRLPSAAQRQAVAAAGAMLCESDYRLEWMDEPWADVARASEWLLKLEQVFRPDVIHLNGYVHGSLEWRAPVCMVAHSCVLSWWRAVHDESAPSGYQRYRAEVRRGLQAASRIVAPTRAMAEMLQREHGYLQHLSVIPNGLASGLADGNQAVPPDLAHKEPFVLAAGRLWDSAKNVRALQQAAPALHWPVYVAGDESLAGAAGGEQPSSVSWLGFLPKAELAAYMRRAAIFAAPAYYEPFGLAILEAAAAGCALVLGNIPSLRELWLDAALFVDPRDSAALVRALTQLSESPALREELGQRASRRARRFGAEPMGRSYLTLYQSLLSYPSPRANMPPTLTSATRERAARSSRQPTEHRS